MPRNWRDLLAYPNLVEYDLPADVIDLLDVVCEVIPVPEVPCWETELEHNIPADWNPALWERGRKLDRVASWSRWRDAMADVLTPQEHSRVRFAVAPHL